MPGDSRSSSISEIERKQQGDKAGSSKDNATRDREFSPHTDERKTLKKSQKIEREKAQETEEKGWFGRFKDLFKRNTEGKQKAESEPLRESSRSLERDADRRNERSDSSASQHSFNEGRNDADQRSERTASPDSQHSFNEDRPDQQRQRVRDDLLAAGRAALGAGDHLMQGMREVPSSVKLHSKDAWQHSKDKAKDTWQRSKDTAKDAWKYSTDKAKAAVDHTRSGLRKAGEAASKLNEKVRHPELALLREQNQKLDRLADAMSNQGERLGPEGKATDSQTRQIQDLTAQLNEMKTMMDEMRAAQKRQETVWYA